MIVELLDYRPQRNKEPIPVKPDRTRVVLHPNAETIWADICLLNHKTGNKWTDNDALEIEARLLVTCTPLLFWIFLNPSVTLAASDRAAVVP
jgi:transcription factor SPT20